MQSVMFMFIYYHKSAKIQPIKYIEQAIPCMLQDPYVSSWIGWGTGNRLPTDTWSLTTWAMYILSRCMICISVFTESTLKSYIVTYEHMNMCVVSYVTLIWIPLDIKHLNVSSSKNSIFMKIKFVGVSTFWIYFLEPLC